MVCVLRGVGGWDEQADREYVPSWGWLRRLRSKEFDEMAKARPQRGSLFSEERFSLRSPVHSIVHDAVGVGPSLNCEGAQRNGALTVILRVSLLRHRLNVLIGFRLCRMGAEFHRGRSVGPTVQDVCFCVCRPDHGGQRSSVRRLLVVPLVIHVNAV